MPRTATATAAPLAPFTYTPPANTPNSDAEFAKAVADFLHGYMQAAKGSNRPDQQNQTTHAPQSPDFTPAAQARALLTCAEFIAENRHVLWSALYVNAPFSFKQAGAALWQSTYAKAPRAGFLAHNGTAPFQALQRAANALPRRDTYIGGDDLLHFA
jgi:hypothetical protein